MGQKPRGMGTPHVKRKRYVRAEYPPGSLTDWSMTKNGGIKFHGVDSRPKLVRIPIKRKKK